jgi:predicted outer membrane protein
VLDRLHLANIQAIVMGKQAEKKGQSRDVRELAAQLARNHTAADQRALEFAKRRKLEVSVTGQTLAEPVHRGGRSFDDRFLTSTVDLEDKLIAEVARSRDASSDDALNGLLDSMRSLAESQRELAQSIIDDRSKR